MSVGAGSIKRAASTMKAEKKADMSVAAEAAEDGKEKAAEAAAGEKERPVKKAASRKGKMTEKEPSEKKTAPIRADEGAIGKSAGQVPGQGGKQAEASVEKPEAIAAKASAQEAGISEKAGTYEVYGVGQQLPVYLL